MAQAEYFIPVADKDMGTPYNNCIQQKEIPHHKPGGKYFILQTEPQEGCPYNEDQIIFYGQAEFRITSSLKYPVVYFQKIKCCNMKEDTHTA
jgi:hypothetical protein